MALLDHDLAAPWTLGLPRARPVPAAWPMAWIAAGTAPRLRRLLGSDLFAFALGGVLWSGFVLVVVLAPST